MSLLTFLAVSYDGLGQAISTDDIVFDEIGHLCFPQICGRGSLHPFSEVIHSHKNESTSIRSLGVNHTDCVNAPHQKRPWFCHVVQPIQWLIDFICTILAKVAF